MRVSRTMPRVVVGLAIWLGSGCTERPDTEPLSLFTTVDVVVATPAESDVVSRAIAMVEAAERSCWLAAETFTSTSLADALVAAQARGVDVRSVGDVDLREQPGFTRLAERLQPVFGSVPMRFGDGPLVYNPQLVDTVQRRGDHNRMTHNFLVCDEAHVLTVTGGFGPDDIGQVGVEVHSHTLGRDFADEFNQLYGGVYAATLSAFNGPLKSITDNREWYDSNVGRMEAYFGPQERLMKRVVDAVYASRANVWIVTEELTSAPLVDALRYKARSGFDVRVVIAESGRSVESSRFDALTAAFDGLDNARVETAASVGTNAVIIDSLSSPIDGRRYPARVMLSSQPLLAATSIVEGQVTTARAADAFSDANMIVLNRYPTQAVDAVGEVVDALAVYFEGVR